MRYFNEFYRSINIYSCNSYPKFEHWRHSINHEDKYMPFLFSYHLKAFIAGCHRIASPLSGAILSSKFTLVTRGGGHNNGKRGNTGLFILYGFEDVDGTLVLLGSMDVFSWWTHLIIPSKGIFSLLVACDDSEWYQSPVSMDELSICLQRRTTSNIIPDRKSCRTVFLGTSESAGHAVWNDLSGLRSYYRQAAIHGYDLCAVRVSYSLLSAALSNREIREIIGACRIYDHSKVDISQMPLLFKGTVFKPLDFVLDVNILKKTVAAYRQSDMFIKKSFSQNSTGLKQDTKALQIKQATVIVWANIRSPLETKRAVCANYAQILSSVASNLRKQHNVFKLILVIDGWTGSTERDSYTSSVQDQHLKLANALERSCQNLFDSVIIAVGSSLMEKINLASSDSRIISICQYGSGIIYGSVIANDIAIVMDPDPFDSVGAGYEPLLGRVDNVRNCSLKLAYIKGNRALHYDNPRETYVQVLSEMISNAELEDYVYTIPPATVLHALDKCIQSGEKYEFTYIDANTYKS